jgi:nucleotide-binding universal stress UspA family protein
MPPAGPVGWAEKYPDVKVSRHAIHTLSPAAVLRDSAARAGLLVVGSRGRGGFTGLLLGSVSRAVVSHAAGSVAVIHKH